MTKQIKKSSLDNYIKDLKREHVVSELISKEIVNEVKKNLKLRILIILEFSNITF